MASPRLRAFVSRSGLPNVEVDGVPYYGPYDPRREAHKFYSSYPIEKADIVLHFGWGLGYVGEALQERLKAAAKVVIFEPDEELFKFSLLQIDNHRVLQDPRFEFVVGPRVCQFFDESALEGCQETDEFLWLMWPVAARTNGSTAEKLMASFRTRLGDRL